jgi:hypothetical protein
MGLFDWLLRKRRMAEPQAPNVQAPAMTACDVTIDQSAAVFGGSFIVGTAETSVDSVQAIVAACPPLSGQHPPVVGFEIEGPSPTEVGDFTLFMDDFCDGDTVWFDRIGPQMYGMRLLLPEQALAFQGKRYRIDRGSAPGSIKITFLGEGSAF